MRARRSPLAGASFVLVLALAVAGCDGGGSVVDASATSPSGTSGGSTGSSSGSSGSTSGGSTGTPTPSFEVAAWVPYWNTQEAYDSLWREIGSIDTVHLFWHEMRSDGSVGPMGNAHDPQLVRDLQNAGVDVVPTITDGFASGRAGAVVGDPALRADHVQAIVDLVRQEGYDGVDLDYEAMDGSDADAFATFVEDLAGALHPMGKKVTVAVYAKTNAGTWSGPLSHDYGRLSRAADRVNIMGYGYGYSGGPPNPIGPVHWLEQVADYAASQGPADKFLMGLPFYGRDWPQGQNGNALTHDGVASLLQQYNPSISYDPRDGEATFSYVDGSGTSHEVWFQTEQGYADKTQVVVDQGLGGIALWALGGEDPAIWNAIEARRTAVTP